MHRLATPVYVTGRHHAGKDAQLSSLILPAQGQVGLVPVPPHSVPAGITDPHAGLGSKAALLTLLGSLAELSCVLTAWCSDHKQAARLLDIDMHRHRRCPSTAENSDSTHRWNCSHWDLTVLSAKSRALRRNFTVSSLALWSSGSDCTTCDKDPDQYC